MKKLLLFTLGVLLYNVAIGFLAFVAVFFGLMGGQPILLIVSVLLALPGLLLQPWFILFFDRPGNFWFYPLYVTAITVPVYALLNRYGAFEGSKRWWARLNHRKVGVYTLGGLVLALGLGYGSWVDFPPLHRGVLPELQVPGKPFPIPVSNSRYYCLGEFMDSEWLWQARMSGDGVERFAKMEGLQPLRQDKIGRSFYHMPPYWWRPVITDKTKVLSTPAFPMDGRGDDGCHVLAAWNPDDQVIHVWIKVNL